MNRDIEELLRLLTCDDLSPQAAAERAALVRHAPQDTQFAWLETPADAMASAICQVLDEYLIEGDKLDELHQLVCDAFDEPFHPFPHKDPAVQKSAFAYFRWLDGILGQRGYAMISAQFDIDENVRLFLVRRQDAPRILALAKKLDLPIHREEGRSG